MARTKVAPDLLALRRIGKCFYVAEEFLSMHHAEKHTPAISTQRKSGRGKQPFSNYIKHLQQKVEMSEHFIELLKFRAEEQGYEMTQAFSIEKDDMEQPWIALRESYRDSNGEAMSNHEAVTLKVTVMEGSQESYIASFPLLSWTQFWLESKINAAERHINNLRYSFDMMGITGGITLDEALQTDEAKKGMLTYKNKKGANKSCYLVDEDAKLVRYKGRLKNALSDCGMTESALREIIAMGNVAGTEMKRAAKLIAKVAKMEAALIKRVEQASEKDRAEYEMAKIRKEVIAFGNLAKERPLNAFEKVRQSTAIAKLDEAKAKLNDIKNSKTTDSENRKVA